MRDHQSRILRIGRRSECASRCDRLTRLQEHVERHVSRLRLGIVASAGRVFDVNRQIVLALLCALRPAGEPQRCGVSGGGTLKLFDSRAPVVGTLCFSRDKFTARRNCGYNDYHSEVERDTDCGATPRPEAQTNDCANDSADKYQIR